MDQPTRVELPAPSAPAPPPAQAPQPQPPETYRANAMVVIVNERREMLMCLRRDRENWQCVQGGIDQGESVIEAAKREVWEEVGLIVDGFDITSLPAPPPTQQRGPRSEQNVAEGYVQPAVARKRTYSLEVVGVLPLKAEDGPLRYRFPVGTNKSHVSRGIVGQEQTCVVLATHQGEAMRRAIDLRGMNGQKREFVDVKWVPVHWVEEIMGMVKCKEEIFRRVCAVLLRAASVASSSRSSGVVDPVDPETDFAVALRKVIDRIPHATAGASRSS
jgi:8-oxo-dGTP pyrophosphatase MutT (NUDIX family)